MAHSRGAGTLFRGRFLDRNNHTDHRGLIHIRVPVTPQSWALRSKGFPSLEREKRRKIRSVQGDTPAAGNLQPACSRLDLSWVEHFAAYWLFR